MTSNLEAVVAKVLTAHRFTSTTSVDGTHDHGWCGGGDSWATKHISEHEAHVAAEVTNALTTALTRPEVVEAAARAMNAADDEALVRTNFGQLTATYSESATAALTAALAAIPEALGAAGEEVRS